MIISNKNIFVLVGFLSCLGAFFQFLNFGAVPQKFLILSIIIFFLCFKTPRISKDFLIITILFLFLTMYSFVSSLLLFQSLYKSMFAVQGLIYCIAYFLLGTCISLTPRNISYFRKAFLIILVVQFIAVFFKFLFFGIDEADWQGTLSHGTGQLSLLFPLICLPIVMVIFKENYLAMGVFVIALFFFGIIGEKRAIIFLMPLYAIYCLYALNNKGLLRFLSQKSTLITILIVIVCGFLGIMTIPSLNIEASESFQGSISLFFVFNYAIDYLTMDYGGSLQAAKEFAASDKNIQLGRLTIWAFIIDWFVDADIKTKIFGLGYGAVTSSVWLHGSNDVIFDAIGVRGGLSGANYALLEIGLLGLFLQISFMLVSYQKIRSLKKNTINDYDKTMLLILELMFIIFFFDYLFYSTVLFNALPIPFILFVGLGICSSMKTKRAQDGL